MIEAPVDDESPGESDAQTALDPGWAGDASLAFSDPEVGFVARIPAPEPPRPRPASRRGIFFDVENTSRPEHVAHVLDHLALDWIEQGTEVIAVGNWRVIGHETARILARRGAQLVHSAPSVGVRDWSDLRIAVAAGAWLAATRPGDVLEVVSDDQAFDAVGDVAASLGVSFRRLSYRGLAGLGATVVVEETPAEARPRRRRRGGRRGRYDAPPARREISVPRIEHVPPIAASSNDGADEAEPHTAPNEEIVDIVRELLAASPGGVMLDTLSNTLKARGFRRPPGSLRLVTRVRRIKDLEVDRGGMIRLIGGTAAAAAAVEPQGSEDEASAPEEATAAGEETSTAGEETAPRRRRRRGGRRRRGRGRAGGAESSSDQAEG